MKLISYCNIISITGIMLLSDYSRYPGIRLKEPYIPHTQNVQICYKIESKA